MTLSLILTALISTTPPLRADRIDPGYAHHLSRGEVFILSGEAEIQMLTLTDAGWTAAGQTAVPGQIIYDGAFENVGKGEVMVLDLDAVSIDFIAPGHNFVIGTPGSGYKKQCLCKCGDGWVAVGDVNPCNANNPNLDGVCIDPTDEQLEDGYSQCREGWGPSSAAFGPND